MNQTLVGVLGTLVTLGGIGVMAGNEKAPPPAQVVQAGALSQEQLDAIQRTVEALNPGAKVKVELDHKDGGTLHTYEEGTGKGANAKTEGDKMSDKITGEAPVVERGADGSGKAKGGSIEKESEASAVKMPPLPWQNPLFWVGLALLAACGGCVYLQLRRAALITGVGGVGLLAAAFYPIIFWFAIVGVLIAVFGPYLYAEFKKKKAEQDDEESYEALRAMVGGAYHRDLENEFKKVIDSLIPSGTVDQDKLAARLKKVLDDAITKEASDKDKKTIEDVMREDRVGVFDK